MPCDFDFDIKKKEWRPKNVQCIVNEISRAFCTKIPLEELRIQGTDYMQKKRIKHDDDLKIWMKTEPKTYEKLIKVKIPQRIVPDSWQPKKDRLLVRGEMIAKYFGDEEVSTRQVQFTLKFHDCGFFRLKQTLPGSGAHPYWVIFEGKWERTEKGFAMEWCLRYPYQKYKKHDFDLAFEAMPEDNKSNLAFADEREAQINGMIPAIVGTDPFSWVELVQEHDAEHNPKSRFAPEEGADSDDPDVKDGRPEQPEPEAGEARSFGEDARPGPAVKSGFLNSSKAKRAPDEGATEHGKASSALGRTADEKSGAARSSTESVVKADEEPVWPLYIAAALFFLMFFMMVWSHWGTPSEEEF